MSNQRVGRGAIKMGLLGLIGMSFIIANSQTSFAGNCGGHCQAGHMCGSMVSKKGVKSDQRRAEYQKCMMDPQNYK